MDNKQIDELADKIIDIVESDIDWIACKSNVISLITAALDGQWVVYEAGNYLTYPAENEDVLIELHSGKMVVGYFTLTEWYLIADIHLTNVKRYRPLPLNDSNESRETK